MRRSFKLNWGSLCLALLLAVASFALDGCPMLLVPSLAYQGYKYEKQRNTKTTTTPSTSGGNKNPSPANQPANDNSIE